MNIAIAYDPEDTITTTIARAISAAIPSYCTVELFAVKHDATPDKLQAADLIIVGSPDQHGQPSPVIQSYLSAIPRSIMRQKSVALFDTKLITGPPRRLGAALKRFAGHATTRMASILRSKGSRQLVHPEDFELMRHDVSSATNEIHHAQDWAKNLVSKVSSGTAFPMP